MKVYSKLIQSLKQIFPLYLLLLAFSPLLLSLFLNYDLFDIRSLGITLVWLPFFTVPYLLFKNKPIYLATVTIYFIIGAIEIGHWIILKGPITITSLLVISNTNLQETIEFFDLKASFGLLLLLPYSLIYVLSLKSVPKVTLPPLGYYLTGLAVIIALVFIFENALNGRFIRKGVPQIAKVTYTFIEDISLYKEAMKDATPRNVQAKTLLKQEQTFVLILGESCGRRHMSIYGYNRNTNPKLGSRDDIILYNNVISGYSNTLGSVLSMLSQSNLDNNLKFGSCVDLIDIFHSAGFKTFWISNQSPIGIWDNMITGLAKKSESVTFVNTTSNSSFESTYSTSYDDKVLSPLKKVLEDHAPKKFIVLQLMGSHSKYSKRYPTKFSTFSGNTKKERVIAEYDNSVLYNDFIVDSLLNIISSHSQKQSLVSAIYLSDHGENVYDENESVGHDYAGTIPKVNVEVPFIVYLSDQFKKSLPDKTNLIQSNKGRPYIINDLFHSVLDLNSLSTPFLDSTRSVFSNRLKERPRVLEDGQNYDR